MKRLAGLLGVLSLLPASAGPTHAVPANSTPQLLPFAQAQSNSALITTDDDLAGVGGIVSYCGDDLVTTVAAGEDRLRAGGTNNRVDGNANRTDANIFTTGGVAEFDLAHPLHLEGLV